MVSVYLHVYKNFEYHKFSLNPRGGGLLISSTLEELIGKGGYKRGG